jgi:hypothetical protein
MLQQLSEPQASHSVPLPGLPGKKQSVSHFHTGFKVLKRTWKTEELQRRLLLCIDGSQNDIQNAPII